MAMINSQKMTALVCVGAMLSGCATMADQPPRTEMEKAVSACAGAVIIGALLGAAIGNNTGSGDAKKGAMKGAVVGGAVCVVLLAMANEKDKEQLAQAQRAAVAADRPQRISYRGTDGRNRVIAIAAPTAAVDPEPQPGTQPRVCRMTAGRVGVTGVGESDLPSQLWCRTAIGDWEPVRT